MADRSPLKTNATAIDAHWCHRVFRIAVNIVLRPSSSGVYFDDVKTILNMEPWKLVSAILIHSFSHIIATHEKKLNFFSPMNSYYWLMGGNNSIIITSTIISCRGRRNCGSRNWCKYS